MSRRNLENLYIPANRAGNERYRVGYDRITWDNKYPEEIKMDAIERQFEKIDFPDWMKPVLGHFC